MQNNSVATPLSETIEIVADNTEWARGLLAEISKSSYLVAKLKGAAIVSLETKADGHHLQDFYGVHIVLRELKKNPDRLVICCGFAPLELVRKLNPTVDVLLSKPNVLFRRMPLSVDGLVSTLQQAEVEKPKQAAAVQQAAKAMSDYVAQEVASILHRLQRIDISNPQDDYEKSLVTTAVTQARVFFPALANASNEQIVDFLVEASSQRQEVMKGERVVGVFCDIEGTLLQGGSINQNVLDMLRQYANDGMAITVWTDGDVKELSSKLQKLGVMYAVKSKFDFAGAIAEIVLDDMDEFSFTARTKIYAETFIRVA